MVHRGEANFAAARLGPHLLVCSSEARFAVKRLGLHRSEATRIPGLYIYPRRTFVSSKQFLVCPFVSCFFLCAFFFSDFEPLVTTMVSKKTVPAKRHRSGSISRVAPPSLEDPRHFISREVERLYHESLCIRSFVRKPCFSTSNAFFNFTIQTQGWQTLCAPLTPGVAPVVHEFYSNLPF